MLRCGQPVSRQEEIWGHQFQLGVLGGAVSPPLPPKVGPGQSSSGSYYNNTNYSGLKGILFILNLEIYKKNPLLIIFGDTFLGACSS